VVGVVVASFTSGLDAIFHPRGDYILDIRTQNGLEHLSSGQYEVAIATWCYFGDHDSV
jgi:hypothetical protein